MGSFKPKGKHAQGAHVELTDMHLDEIEEQASEAEQLDSAPEIAAPLPEISIASEEPLPGAEYFTEIKPDDGESLAGLPPSTDAAQYMGVLSTSGHTPMTADGVVLRKKHRVGKIIGITFGIIIGILLIAYIAGAVLFMGRFFPKTSIIGEDVSMMPNDEVVALLDKTADSYAIKVTGNGFNYGTTAKDIDLAIDSQGVVEAVHSNLSPWAWPVILIEGEHDVTDMVSVTFDKKAYEPELTSAVDTYNASATPPVNATIAYDEKTQKFNIVKEVAGTQYDSKTILSAMDVAISTLEPEIKLTSDFLIQPTVLSSDERLVNSAELASGLVKANITLTMAGQPAAVINGSNLASFIRVDENYGVTLDEAALDQWVIDVSNGFDTIGTERTYTRADGKVITVSGGSYGWSTDALALKDEIVAAIKAGETRTIDIPCQQTAAVYNGPGQPDWGNRYIDVDISEQYVRFYGDDGNIIWETACISGTPDGEHDTGRGVWYVNNKESPSKLIGYENGVKIYETTVTYWMAFESSDIGFHDATWQPAFGGTMYMEGYGSHGCVNLSYGDAESLYGIVQVGDCVVVHD